MPARAPLRGQPRRLFTSTGEEVHLSMPCASCGERLSFEAFGFRRTADGLVRSIPWCGPCRSAASPKRPRVKQPELPFAEVAGG